MFHHVKELQFNARVSRPDVGSAKLMLEQFGGPNGDLKNAADESDHTIMLDGTVYVKESLRYLMTREVAHFQMFQSALDSIPANFPPGILQSDPKFSNKYFNMSKGEDFKGAWNEGKSPLLGEEWQYIDNPLQHVRDTNGLLNEVAEGTERTEKSVQKQNKALSAERKTEVAEATLPKNAIMSWTVYEDGQAAESNGKKKATNN